jgi:uncharacterized surface protein with fasciclin (FAS1) repeats
VKRSIAAALATMLAVLAIAAPAALAATTRHKTPPPTTPQQNLFQVASANRRLTTLVTLVKSAGLVRLLSSPTQRTLFAPTNAAFARVPRATMNTLATNKRALRRLLLYHIANGALPTSTLVSLGTVRTLAGPDVTIRASGGKVFVNQARIVNPNVPASNGILHVINRVLMPAS